MLWCQTVTGPLVRFKTTMGDIDVTLFPNDTPLTVANFLRYVNKGAYNNSFVHRLVAGFIWQGGGYVFKNNDAEEIPQDPPVRNEFRFSNVRGTIAMAKLGNNPNSATNQWFFNLGNNSANLNFQNGGFTVFGRVANDASLAVMDRIAATPVYQLESPFDSLPLANYRGGNIAESNLVIIRSIEQVNTNPAPAVTGIVSASGFGAFPSASPGSFIEIYGTNLGGTASRTWAATDFNNGAAPTTLEGVSVTINGRPAFINYVSPTLVNVQVPADVPVEGNVPVIVSYQNQSSPPFNLAMKAAVPGLLAPATFKVGERQYIVAVNAANSSFASNGTIPNTTNTPAGAGETYLFFGIGFGAVDNANIPIAGRTVTGTANIVAPVRVKIGDRDATVGYAGLAPNLVGLYQFNVTLPADVPSGDQPVEVTLGNERVAQNLFISVR